MHHTQKLKRKTISFFNDSINSCPNNREELKMGNSEIMDAKHNKR